MTIITQIPWTKQPQINAIVRPSIEQNLSVLVLGSRRDFIGCGPITEAGGITRNPSGAGIAWEGDGTDNIAWAIPNRDGSLAATGEHYFTLIVVFRKRATGASTGHIAGYGSSAGAGGNTLHRLVGGSTADQIQFQLQTSTGALLYNTASASAGINDQQWHCAVVPYQSTTTTANDSLVYWIDGVQRGSVARSVGAANTTFDRASVGSGLRGGSLISAGNWDVALYAHLLTRMPDAWCAKTSQLTSVWDAVFQPRYVWMPQSIATGAYTLNAETGAYTFTGSNATLLHNYALTLESASYSLTGSNATLLKGLILDAASGSYTLTGSDATFVYNKLLNASSGSYSVTGADANLIYTPATGAYTLNAESGAYLLTGSDVTFAYSGGLITLKAGSWIRYRIIT